MVLPLYDPAVKFNSMTFYHFSKHPKVRVAGEGRGDAWRGGQFRGGGIQEFIYPLIQSKHI